MARSPSSCNPMRGGPIDLGANPWPQQLADVSGRKTSSSHAASKKICPHVQASKLGSLVLDVYFYVRSS